MHDFPKRPTRTCSFHVGGANDNGRKPLSRQQQEPQPQESAPRRRTQEQEDAAALRLEQDVDEDDASSVSYSVWLESMSPQAPRRALGATTTANYNHESSMPALLCQSFHESSMPGLLSFSLGGSSAGSAFGLSKDFSDSVSSLDCSLKNLSVDCSSKNEERSLRGPFPDLADSAANILQPRVQRSSSREELRWGSSNHSNDSMPSYKKRINSLQPTG
jgi:hypothetical protein